METEPPEFDSSQVEQNFVPPISVHDLVAALEKPMLTARQLEVLDLASRGYRHRQTAVLLSISPITVLRHREAIRDQFNAHNMTEAVQEGFDSGWLKLDQPNTSEVEETETSKLSPTEHYELIMAAKGLDRAATARARGISPLTSKNIRYKLLIKLGVDSMPHAVRKAREAGISTYEDPSLDWLDSFDY